MKASRLAIKVEATVIKRVFAFTPIQCMKKNGIHIIIKRRTRNILENATISFSAKRPEKHLVDSKP